MKIIRRFILPSLTAVACLLLVAWFARFKILRAFYKMEWENGSNEALILKHETAFMEDRQILSEYDVFKPSFGSNDAGPFLNPKVTWEGPVNHKGDLTLPSSFRNELNKEWLTNKISWKDVPQNFDWMKELKQYDYWSPDQNSPAYPEGKKYHLHDYPTPDFSHLMRWSKLRLLQGRETHDIAGAFTEVRQLARLIWTTDYPTSHMASLSILRSERVFYESLTPELRGEWKVIPQDVTDRASRHYYSLEGIITLHLSEETFHKMTDTDVGICLLLTHGMKNYLYTRDLLKEDFEAKYDKLDKLVKDSLKTKCRRSFFHQIWDDPTWVTFVEDDQNPFGPASEDTPAISDLKWKDVKVDKDIKQTLGYFSLSIPSPNFFSQYEKMIIPNHTTKNH